MGQRRGNYSVGMGDGELSHKIGDGFRLGMADDGESSHSRS